MWRTFRFVLGVFSILAVGNAFAGGLNLNLSKNDSSNFLKEGHFGLHLRTVGMHTQNRGDLLNFSAITTGAGMHYKSAENRMFQIGASGFFIFRMYQHNLENVDPISGAGSRYEITLLDMHDPENGTDLDRLEDLYLRFKKKNLEIVIGRQEIESPLLNRQDNRMRPNIFQGVVSNYTIKDGLVTAAWLTAVTPRGTVDWYSIEESMGVYPFGRDVDGNISQFPGNTATRGIFMAGLQKNIQGVNTQVWNYYTENVFNLTFVQSDFENDNWKLGFQGFYQSAIGQGGNAEINKAFIMPNEQTYALGGQVGHRVGQNLLTLNYLHIANEGRFLFPREWGREKFYASLNRERFEGNGGLDAYTLRYVFNHYNDVKGKLSLGASVVNNAGLESFRLNKYGMPAYYHFAAVYDYLFTGKLSGLSVRALAAAKLAQDRNTDIALLSNRADMGNFTLLIDYRF
ncbi:MAG: OprD family outer membrane porin [Luteibaculaceae bacterium]